MLAATDRSDANRGDGLMSETDELPLAQFHAFERDLLFAVCAFERDCQEPPKGSTIKQHLERDYGEEINHSWLYKSLNALVADELLTKNQMDSQTREYATTETARELLEAQARKRIEQVALETDRSTPQRDETSREPTASLLPDAEDATVLFDGEEMDVDELSESSGTWIHETEIGRIEVRFEWNEDFFTHTSALVGPDQDLVPLDFESSYSPGIDPVFVPTNEQYDFRIELVGDDASSNGG